MKTNVPAPVRGATGGDARWPAMLFAACRLVIVAALALAPTASPALPPLADLEMTSGDGAWTLVGQASEPERMTGPRKYSVHRADPQRLRQKLQEAPPRFLEMATGAIIEVPMPDGRFVRMALKESSIFSPELQAQYADIRTYHGVGVDDPGIQGRLDITPAGFHAMLFTDDGVVFVDPVQRGDASRYMSYWKADLAGKPFTCEVHGSMPTASLAKLFAANNPSGTQLRTYRLAVSVTGEYTNFFGGSAGAAAQIATTVNRVTGIYERDLAIRLTLVATRIFTDPATDPFPQAKCDLRSENQAELDANVGNANYDIGHVFSAGGLGGVASLGSVCVTGSKARGCTSLGNPSGDAFDVDFVAHEIGHQFGGNHTWSGDTCGPADQFVASAAYEPGSGTTIMGYAGVCAGLGANGQNIAAHSDPFFHSKSFDEILAFRTSGNGSTCGTTAATGNQPPTVEAGPNCTVPQGTPFTLTAQGAEPDSDAMTFDWEQYDAAATWVSGFPSATAMSGPLFRFRPPTTSPSRTFPPFSEILAGTTDKWEVLPTVDRTLNFRVVARDNRLNGGGVDWDSMQVTVSGAPFQVVAPAQGAQWQCGGQTTISWNVGGGSVAPNLDIQTSTDGGASFSTLVANTANDGSELVTVPKTLTNIGRVMLKPTTQCFFAVSRGFSIVDTLAPTVNAPANASAECSAPTGTPVAIGSATANDQCDASPVVSSNAPAVFPLGVSTVTWKGRDASGNEGTAVQTVTVTDTIPPTITAPPNVTAECTSPAGTPVAIGTPTVNDICDASPAVTNDAPAVFPLGTRTVKWTAKDASNNQSTVSQLVKVQDTTAPVVQASVGKSVLWPANHGFANVGLGAGIVEACDANPVVAVKVFGNEDDEEPTGDGNFSPDAAGIGLGTLQLRSERKGDGEGRVYLVVVSATDASGNVGVDCATVIVPHDQSAAALAALGARAAAAKASCVANKGAAPAGYFVVGDGPAIGPR